jgi:tetratricopeptide (TPR) repeat protein
VRTDQGELDKAARHYREAANLGRTLRDDALQAAAYGGLAGLDYRQQRYRAAERNYRLAIARYGDKSTPQLAEDLGGRFLSGAAQGKLDEEVVERLIDVSGSVGWDRHAAEELSLGAAMLAEAPADGAAAIAGLSLVVAWRGSGCSEDDAMKQGVRATAITASWMAGRDDYGVLKDEFVDQIATTVSREAAEVARSSLDDIVNKLKANAP